MNYIRKYVLVVLFLALGSNYVQDYAGFIPRPREDWVMWKGLTDLRESLLERGMLNEALALFKVERSRLPPMERIDAVIQFQDSFRSHFSLSEERSLWIEADLAIYASQSLYERREGVKGSSELVRAEKFLDEWCSKTEYPLKETLTPALEVRLTRLRCSDFDDEPKAYYQESSRLLELMRRCCHASTTVSFGHVIEAARLLMTPSETDPYRMTFYKRLHELQEYQQDVLEDIRGMLYDQAPLFTEASNYSAKDSNKVLEWLDGFEAKYPAFNIPKGLEIISSRRRMIYVHRRELDKQAEEDAKLEKLKSGLPGQSGVLTAIRKSKPGNLPPNVDSSAAAAFPIDVDEENFLMAWFDVIGKPKETRTRALRLLAQWIMFDFNAGVIKDSEISALLGVEAGADGSSSVATQLETLSPTATFRKLYLSGEEPSETTIDVRRWAGKSQTLESWLLRPSEPSLNGRQFLWVVLQEIRIESTIEYKAPLDVIITSIQRCISVVETLRPKVKEFVSQKIVVWRGNIVNQCFLYCISCLVFNTREVGEHLTLSVDICLEILDQFEKQGDSLQLAARQRTTGEICLFKLYWMLLQPGLKVSDPSLVKLQKIGLDCLEKADGFFTPLLQEVTWSQGLKSVQERERSVSTSTSWRIPQLAVRLLVAGGIPTDNEKRKAIWTWVQRSKARALALAMGTTGKVPAALLQQIMASDEHRALYERCTILEQQIQAAESQNRFALRREMDLHILRMRKHRPLAELWDIREGKPLSLPDLEKITNLSGSSVVLVDWFYAYLNAYDEGSILLLTVRSGSTPTISILPITPPQVIQWIDANLDGEFSDYSRKDLSALEPLVQSLIDLTKKDETLVFCASSNLNRIPLHAIDIETLELPLIHRNPIVYMHSHSVLRMCLWNAREAAEAKSPLKPLIMNGIPDIPGNAAWSAGRKSVQALAGLLKVDPYLNSSGTKANFLTHAPSSRLIHVHSHVEWTAADPLAHSIHFASPTSKPQDADDYVKLAAREVFAISFPLGSHVSLIACSGGLARISPEDEVMGLVPALLYAGASSTISTLWPIKDEAGAAFALAFHWALEKRRKGNEGGGWVDLAKVFQKAAIERDLVETEEVKAKGGKLHWTAFVMHGFWQFWMPLMDERM